MWSSHWKPLFDGSAAGPYQTAVFEVAEAVARETADETDLGRPLLLAYLASVEGSSAMKIRAENLVAQSIAGIERRPTHGALYGGVAGVGWLVAHTDLLFDRRDDEFFEDVDDLLLRSITTPASLFNYDLVSGAVGVGVYFIERLPQNKASDALSRIVDALEVRAERNGDDLTWHTPPALVSKPLRMIAPNGLYNLGVAHGIPGIVAFLSELDRVGASTQKSGEMLEGTVRWVLSKRLPSGFFPMHVVPGVAPVQSRLAWCYGELGIAVTLLAAARARSDTTMEQHAIDIGLLAARRRVGTGTIDAGLCHGAAGNAHLFNRLFQATNRPKFQEAAEFWFSRALESRVPGEGFAEYRAWKAGSWDKDIGFLTGSTGIALAFLAATTSLEPNWDRLLLSGLAPISKRVPPKSTYI